MDDVFLEGICPLCSRVKAYTTRQGFLKGRGKPCKSCSNSLKAGGVGGERKCFDCGEKLNYNKSASLCLECHNKRTLKYHREVYRFRRYGTSREWYEIECLKGCAICKKPLNPYSEIKRERGHIDHCHSSGVVRGVLCDLCNKGLGQFKDSILSLESAIAYLKGDK